MDSVSVFQGAGAHHWSSSSCCVQAAQTSDTGAANSRCTSTLWFSSSTEKSNFRSVFIFLFKVNSLQIISRLIILYIFHERGQEMAFQKDIVPGRRKKSTGYLSLKKL